MDQRNRQYLECAIYTSSTIAAFSFVVHVLLGFGGLLIIAYACAIVLTVVDIMYLVLHHAFVLRSRAFLSRRRLLLRKYALFMPLAICFLVLDKVLMELVMWNEPRELAIFTWIIMMNCVMFGLANSSSYIVLSKKSRKKRFPSKIESSEAETWGYLVEPRM